MPIEIVETTAEQLAQYEMVPITFEVTSRYDVIRRNFGDEFLLVEQAVQPYRKDYDAHENERPTSWPAQFDLANWGFLAARDGKLIFGVAAIAFPTPAPGMVECRDDVASLWDIRVHPAHRGVGIGTRLFDAAANWARGKGYALLKIETQDTNVPACRFYARQGCVLKEVNFDTYPAQKDEAQLIWYLDL